MPALWQQPELFLGGVIRHSLAPGENRNTKLASIRFAQAYLALIFVIDSKTRLGAPTAWGRRGSSPKNKTRKDAKQLMVSVEPRPCPVNHTGLCRMGRGRTIGDRQDSRGLEGILESRFGMISDSA